MKTLDLSMYNAKELTAEESVSINGGNPWIAFAVSFIILQVITNPREHWDAFMKGFDQGVDAVEN